MLGPFLYGVHAHMIHLSQCLLGYLHKAHKLCRPWSQTQKSSTFPFKVKVGVGQLEG